MEGHVTEIVSLAKKIVDICSPVDDKFVIIMLSGLSQIMDQ
jgi:hypothetical protein